MLHGGCVLGKALADAHLSVESGVRGWVGWAGSFNGGSAQWEAGQVQGKRNQKSNFDFSFVLLFVGREIFAFQFGLCLIIVACSVAREKGKTMGKKKEKYSVYT